MSHSEFYWAQMRTDMNRIYVPLFPRGTELKRKLKGQMNWPCKRHLTARHWIWQRRVDSSVITIIAAALNIGLNHHTICETYRQAQKAWWYHSPAIFRQEREGGHIGNIYWSSLRSKALALTALKGFAYLQATLSEKTYIYISCQKHKPLPLSTCRHLLGVRHITGLIQIYA
jgi:hypothetical protein